MIVSVIDQDDYRINYAYRADGQRAEVKVLSPPVDPNYLVYHVAYSYDTANRLKYVKEPLLSETDNYIAGFDYDCKGNRAKTTYYLAGSTTGSTVDIAYTYDSDNHLTDYSTTGGPVFAMSNASIDGLGRLTEADETVINPNGNPSTHSLEYTYDMRSQVTGAEISNINGGNWSAAYEYTKAGNLSSRTIQAAETAFAYDGDLMETATGAENFLLDWDKNGCMIYGVNSSLTYNWNGKLRSASAGSDSISLRYDPAGNRIYKESTVNQTTTKRKFIVDTAGRFPVTLLIVDPDITDANEAPVKTLIYANNQIIAQHDGNYEDSRYFYLHDRLGSVREVINSSASVANCYTYNPWGEAFDSETNETVSNPYWFAGYYWDTEIDQYYCIARQYDPAIMRFTGMDPVKGKFREPLTLHAYLYCANDPVNRIDPSGEFFTYASFLFARSMDAQLRKADYNFHMNVYDSSKQSMDAFSIMNLTRGAIMDILIADFDGTLASSMRNSTVSTIGLFSDNLARLADIAIELYEDKDALITILENESLGGLFDYGKQKLTDIVLNPDFWLL